MSEESELMCVCSAESAAAACLNPHVCVSSAAPFMVHTLVLNSLLIHLQSVLVLHSVDVNFIISIHQTEKVSFHLCGSIMRSIDASTSNRKIIVGKVVMEPSPQCSCCGSPAVHHSSEHPLTLLQVFKFICSWDHTD